MRWIAFPCLVVVLLTPLTTQTQETEQIVVPAVAYGLPGFGDNLWTSEIYFTNPTSVGGTVQMGYILPGYTVPPDAWNSCGWTGPWTAHIEGHSSERYAVGADLCVAQEAVGAYVFEVSEGMTISSRMVNHDPEAIASCCPFLSGFGTEVPGIPLDELPQAGAHLLPALVWHPERCGPRTFDTYVGFANPYDVEVNVTIDLAGDSADPSNPEFPQNLTVPALSWQQIAIRPPTSDAATCGEPELFDLQVVIDAPLAVYASVVDRGRQDGRVVMPLPID